MPNHSRRLLIELIVLAIVVVFGIVDVFFWDFGIPGRFITSHSKADLCVPVGGSGDSCTCIPKACWQLVKTCGDWDNGCGGTINCGTCPAGQACLAAGQCVAACVPNCIDKTCGSDGCGGSCGTCPTGWSCLANGTCGDTTPPCVPNCTGKTCGSDGCNGTCGTCSSGNICENGRCIPECISDCSGKNCGLNSCGVSCGTCAPGFVCRSNWCAIQQCVPNCTNKACGDDGCNGSCGTCASDSTCVNSQCQINEPPPQMYCYDTDVNTDFPNGKNSQVVGTTNGYDTGLLGTGLFRNAVSQIDTCKSDNTLTEYFCNGIVVESTEITCQDTCENGHCVDANCQQKQCDQQRRQCGNLNNGCGGTINCGNCASNNACLTNSCTTDNYNFGTCSSIYIPGCQACSTDAECWVADKCKTGKCVNNKCQADPKVCPTNQVCDASTGNCKAACVPKTCSQLGKTCGSVDNGCGKQINCGSCGLRQSCDTSGQCKCNILGSILSVFPMFCCSETCASLNRTCGTVSDGCNGSLNCGTCENGQICNESGQCAEDTTVKIKIDLLSPDPNQRYKSEKGEFFDVVFNVICENGTCPADDLTLRYIDGATDEPVSTTEGAEPFYTTTENPQTTNVLSKGQNQEVTFRVNASGNLKPSFKLYGKINPSSQLLNS